MQRTCMLSAMLTTRLVASRWSSTQMKAPQHTMYASPMVFTL